MSGSHEVSRSTPTSEQSGKPPALNCCQGRPAPDGVVQGWKQLSAFPTSSQQAFFELLTSSVVEPDESALATALNRFHEDHGVQRGQALMALQTCQFLLQRSAALDLDPDRFVEDLHALSPEESGALRLLATRYAPLKKRVREELLLQSLADHGKVLVDLDWRVDTVSASDRAVNLNAPVVFLTLQLQGTDGPERVSLQLTTKSVQMLQQFCQRFSDT